jgi:hypothetical protein
MNFVEAWELLKEWPIGIRDDGDVPYAKLEEATKLVNEAIYEYWDLRNS